MLQICRIWLEPMEHFNVNTRFSHSLCGHFVNKMPSGLLECCFCHQVCDAEVVRTFDLKITVADESAKVLAWSTGQTAMDLLQISPEEFYELPEVTFLIQYFLFKDFVGTSVIFVEYILNLNK